MIQFKRGVTLLGQGDITNALTHFEEFVNLSPESREGRLFYAICLVRLQRTKDAKDALAALIDEDPNCYDALVWMAEVSFGEGDFEGATRWAREGTLADPGKPEAWAVLGRARSRLGQMEESVEALVRAVSSAPDVAQYHHSLALAYEEVKRHDRAEEHFRQAIQLAPTNPKSYLALSSSYCRFGLAGKALDVLREGLANLPHCAPLHSGAAAAFTQIRDDREAEHHHRCAAELTQEGRIGFAFWLVDQGRCEEALALFDGLIEENPMLGAAYYGILQCRKLTPEDEPLLTKMESLANDRKVRPSSRMFLAYALGKTYEQEGDYRSAMRQYDEANRLAFRAYSPNAPFDLATLQAETEKLFHCYQDLKERGIWGLRGPAPIFIIGMIRSGTTLLDQIVSSHPQVFNAGELRFWIEKSYALSTRQTPVLEEKLREAAQEYLDYVGSLVGGSERSTDKMPLNFFYAGLIHRAFPDARFLHIRRHPVDTCLSIYTTHLGPGSHFAYNKANTVAYYREYESVMERWRSELPKDRLFELSYEDLISDRERVVRNVVDFCGLPWDESCLHHEDNRSAIHTPARWQARQPVYKTSAERWRNYEPWLGEFAQLLPRATLL